MKEKNSFQITLAGKSYTLAGNESSEYLKRIADHIEQKYADYSSNISYRTQPMDMQHVMLEVNIADDYFKCKEELEILTRKLDEQSIELEHMKNSLVAMQVKYENLESSTKLTQKNYQEAKARIAQLENLQRKNMF